MIWGLILFFSKLTGRKPFSQEGFYVCCITIWEVTSTSRTSHVIFMFTTWSAKFLAMTKREKNILLKNDETYIIGNGWSWKLNNASVAIQAKRRSIHSQERPRSIYIIIIDHHHFVPLARISLTLSHHFSLSFIAFCRSSGLHPKFSHSCCMYVRAGRPAFAWPYAGSIGVHHWWVRPCFSSSVLRVWLV